MAVVVDTKVLALEVLAEAVIMSRVSLVDRLALVLTEIGMVLISGEATLLVTILDSEETSRGGVQGRVA
jgi:hypothetical protein